MNDSFALNMLLLLLGVLWTAQMGFFIWVGRTVIDVRERVSRIEDKVTSLLATRTVQAAEETARTDRRVEKLESDARKEN